MDDRVLALLMGYRDRSSVEKYAKLSTSVVRLEMERAYRRARGEGRGGSAIFEPDFGAEYACAGHGNPESVMYRSRATAIIAILLLQTACGGAPSVEEGYVDVTGGRVTR